MVDQLQADPRTSEEEYFRIVLIQTEAERVKFLVRSYLRARLHKVCLSSFPIPSVRSQNRRRLIEVLGQIEKYATHILSSPELRTRLSVTELTHAQG